jgi:rhodanese-related sulfurtransferase
MNRFFEFLINHWALSGLWLALAAGLLAYLNSKTGSSLSVHQATQLINRENATVVDVRERKDFEKGHVVDAVNIPLAKLAERSGELDKKKQEPLIVVCQYGQQAGEAVKLLQERGFTRVSKLAGGISEWQSQNLPLVR